MKAWMIWLVFLLAGVSWVQAEEAAGLFCPEKAVASAPDRPLSLKEALALSRQRNPGMDEARARIREAEALFREAGAGLWPRLGLSLSWTAGEAPSSYLFKTIDQRRLPGNADFNDPGSFHNTEAALWARMQVFDGGRTGLFREMADLGRREAALGLEDAGNRLAASVIQAFYQVRAAEDFLGISEESVATVSRQLEVMQVQYQGGGVLRSDLLSLEVRLAEAREDQVRCENRLRVALSALAGLLGFCPGQGVHPGAADLVLPELPSDGEAGMALALARRPDLKAMAVSVDRSVKAVRVQARRVLPEVRLEGRYWHDDPDAAFEKDRENWEFAVLADWEIFDGFSRKAGREAALAREEGVRARTQALLLEIRLDVEESLSAVREASARYEVATKAVGLAGESLDLVRRQYEGGAATVTRYLQAELDYNRARVRKTAAFYDRERARADLARALGLLCGEV